MNASILCGDKRMEYAKYYLEEEGINIIPLDKAEMADILLLGVPATKDGEAFFNPIKYKSFSEMPQKLLAKPMLGGYMKFKNAPEGSILLDYAQNNSFILENSLPSAEGAIAVIINETPDVLFRTNTLIIGCGRLSRSLFKRLSLLGAPICVSARKDEDFSYLYSEGIPFINTCEIEKHIGEFDLIVNTVPYKTIQDNALKNAKKGLCIIELASQECTDVSLARNNGIKYVYAPALPGKVAPKYSGNIIARGIKRCLGENKWIYPMQKSALH